MEDEKKKTGYQSTYQDQLKETVNKILNREKFSYDYNTDPLYKQYKNQYTQQGKQAMMDTMGMAQAMTGGYGNSYAQTVGQQTYQGYMQQLNDKMPSLYQLALDKYNSEGNQMMNNANLMMQQDDIDYGRYRDQLADQDTAYSKLMALMTGYGYKPSDAEMAAAGMSASQRDAILRQGAYAPVVYDEEESGGGSGRGSGRIYDLGLDEDQIVELQLRNGLDPDGIAGDLTLNAFNAEIAEIERKDKERDKNTIAYLQNAANNWDDYESDRKYEEKKKKAT